MNRPIKEAEDMARRILACELGESDPAQTDAASRAVEKLRLYLTKFVGSAGFHSLFARAVRLAKRDVPWLAPIQVTAEGLLVGFDEAVRAQDDDNTRKGQLALLTHLLVLLVAFIGQTVTRHMVEEVWTKTRLESLHFSAKETL